MATESSTTDTESLAEKSHDAGLDPHHCEEVTTSRQTQCLNQEDLATLKRRAKQSSKRGALEKRNDIPATSKSAHSSLCDTGIEGTNRAKDVEEEEGATTPDQVTIRSEDESRHTEKTAGKFKRQLFNAETDLDHFHRKHQERLQETRSKAELLLNKGEQLKKADETGGDNMRRAKTAELQQRPSVTENQRKKSYKAIKFDKTPDTVTKDLESLTNACDAKEVVSPSDILASASGGLALRGLTLGKDFTDGTSSRHIVLTAPADVKLMAPSIQPVEEVAHFMSQSQLDHFQHVVDTIGYNAAVSSKGEGFAASIVAEGSRQSKKDSKKDEKLTDHDQTFFESRVILSIVPTAACEMHSKKLRLSPETIDELQKIDKDISDISSVCDRDVINRKCERFLERFGSHVNAGTIHFGGVRKQVTTYNNEKGSKAAQVKKAVKVASDSSLSASFNACGFAPSASGSGSNSKSQEESFDENINSDLTHISTSIIRNGGPEIEDLSLWKKGLISRQSTWAVIDRGGKEDDFVGVWEVILNHKEDFEQPERLASALRQVWEWILAPGEKHYSTLSRLGELLDNVAGFLSGPKEPHKGIQYLEELLSFEEKARSQHCLADLLCMEKSLSSFLVMMVKLGDQVAASESNIRRLLGKIVKVCDEKSFPGENVIMDWLDNKPHVVPASSVFAAFHSRSDLIKAMKQTFLPMVEGTRKKDERLSVGEMIELENCLEKLLQTISLHLPHEACFQKVFCFIAKYDLQLKKIQAPCTLFRLTELVNFLEEWHRLSGCGKPPLEQLEAYLLHASLTCNNAIEQDMELENFFSSLISDIRAQLSPNLKDLLYRFAGQSPFDWKQLEATTGDLAKGNAPDFGKEELDELVEMLQFKSKEYSRQDGTKQQKLNHGFCEILDRLGLGNYYPAKISILQAITISEKEEGSDLLSLPWKMLKKLMMSDFNARDEFLEQQEITAHSDTASSEDFFELDEVANEGGCSPIGTLDVVMILYACCDNFLKQLLAQKLFACKLAVPFIDTVSSQGELTMSVWALRGIVMKWRGVKDRLVESRVTDHPFKIVTFVRIGRPPRSKSILMNEILHSGKHNTFISSGCKNGSVERSISEGVVECSWFLPEGNSNDALSDAAMFLNLRGDAATHGKQLFFLSQVSSVIVVVAWDLTSERSIKAFEHVLEAPPDIILLLEGQTAKDCREQYAHLKTVVDAESLKKIKKIAPFVPTDHGYRSKSLLELKGNVCQELNIFLETCKTVSMEECAGAAGRTGIATDEDSLACCKGRTLAKEVVSHMEGINSAEYKTALLPLQGKVWQNYCQLLRKVNKPTADLNQDDLKQKMAEQQLQQVHLCKNMTPFMKDFVKALVANSNEEEVIIYFVNWLRIYLDDKCRRNLQDLDDNPCSSQEASQTSTALSLCERKQQLVSSAVGLEHMFRELGRIFEAIMESREIGNRTKNSSMALPSVAAACLLRGFPLELIDGDVSIVPITWIRAVLRELARLVGEKQLFIISVLGIQSSGKSTLLNTMFGLQFAVSAGRCTKGAYMQLVPVDPRDKLPFDYVAVIDTEGLRALELGPEKYQNDNELATLVLGLGDLTLINIKGENHESMKEILQIAVYGMIRMKSIKESRKCVFLHQNVAAIDAKEMMREGHQKLIKELDKMTKAAAESEHVPDVHCFSDILKFNIEDHVWYFPDLWVGNPPMAAVNPGYSSKANAVKASLLKRTQSDNHEFTSLTLPQLADRLGDLRKAVLAEDFVFSFRNTLEAKAYSSLNEKYLKLELEFESAMTNWLRQVATIQMRNCEEEKDLETTYETLRSKWATSVAEKHQEIRSHLTAFLEDKRNKQMLLSWNAQTLGRQENAVKLRESEGQEELQRIKDECKTNLAHRKRWQLHEKELARKAEELANSCRGKDLSQEELNKKFEQMWAQIENDLALPGTSSVVKWDEKMWMLLLKIFSDHKQLLRAQHETMSAPSSLALETSFALEYINQNFVSDKDFSVKENWFKATARKAVGTSDLKAQVRDTIVQLTNEKLKEINVALKNLWAQDVRIKESDALVILNSIQSMGGCSDIAQKQHSNKHFTIDHGYIIKLAIHVSKHCVQVFLAKETEYDLKHGVGSKMQRCRKTAWFVFESTVHEKTAEKMATDHFWNVLTTVIETSVSEQLSQIVVEKIREKLGQKSCLIARIMKDLANKANFEEYLSYFRQAKLYAGKWIEDYTNNKMFGSTGNSSTSSHLYGNIAEELVQKIMESIVKAVENITKEVRGQSGNKMQFWTEQFCTAVSNEISVPPSDLQLLAQWNVQDFGSLQKRILEEKDGRKSTILQNNYFNQTASSVKWTTRTRGTPYEAILEKLWGCSAQCPFCREPCSNALSDHYESSGKCHECKEHRPQAIGGNSWTNNVFFRWWSKKGELMIDTCGRAVSSKYHFTCRDCEYECRKDKLCKAKKWDWHKYGDYKSCLPHWDFTPDNADEGSKYWKWFTVKYISEIQKKFGGNIPTLPKAWKKITKEEALEKLK